MKFKEFASSEIEKTDKNNKTEFSLELKIKFHSKKDRENFLKVIKNV